MGSFGNLDFRGNYISEESRQMEADDDFVQSIAPFKTGGANFGLFPDDQLTANRKAWSAEAERIAQTAVKHDRDLTPNEKRKFDALYKAAKEAQEAQEDRASHNRAETELRNMRNGAHPAQAHPLTFPDVAVRDLHRAISARSPFTWEARAALQTSTYGTATNWHGAAPDGPVLLHQLGGADVEILDGIKLSYPTWTLPTASASVGETVTLGEFASSTGSTLTAARFGRWTDISIEASLNRVESITRMHRVGIARDLNKACITALNTAAGAAVTFATSAEFMVKRSIGVICDRTASQPTDLVLIVHPDNLPSFQNTVPTNGSDVGSTVERFAGARIFASSEVATGFALVANLRVGAVYAEAQSMRVATREEVKTSVQTIATSLIGGYGVQVPEAVQLLDIVT